MYLAINLAATLMYLGAEGRTAKEHAVFYPKRQDREDIMEWMGMVCRAILKKSGTDEYYTRHDVRLINEWAVVLWKQVPTMST